MKKISGFTLIEILVVVGLIGMLLLIIVPSVKKSKNNNEVKQMENDLLTIASSLEEYKILCGAYPIRVTWVNGDMGLIDCNLTTISAQRLVGNYPLSSLDNILYVSFGTQGAPDVCLGYHLGFNSDISTIEGNDFDLDSRSAPLGYGFCSGSGIGFNGTDSDVYDIYEPRSLSS